MLNPGCSLASHTQTKAIYADLTIPLKLRIELSLASISLKSLLILHSTMSLHLWCPVRTMLYNFISFYHSFNALLTQYFIPNLLKIPMPNQVQKDPSALNETTEFYLVINPDSESAKLRILSWSKNASSRFARVLKYSMISSSSISSTFFPVYAFVNSPSTNELRVFAFIPFSIPLAIANQFNKYRNYIFRINSWIQIN